MNCPFCNHSNSRVLESRTARLERAIRRRRECEGCAQRFTTFEEVEHPRLFLIKRDGSREEFNREKLLSGMLLACRKRPISVPCLQEIAVEIEREIQESGRYEIPSIELGRKVLARLSLLDEVAYIRFASVYEQFGSAAEFESIVQSLKVPQE